MFECLNINSVVDFIKSHIPGINEQIVAAVSDILPHISNYHEEDKTFSFRIFLGAGELPSIKGRPHILKTLPLEDLSLHAVTKAIKNLTAFCSNSADILIVQEEETVSFGVVYFDIEQTGIAEVSFLKKGFVLMGSLNRTKVALFALGKNDKPENLVLSFDFKDPETLPVPDFSKKYNRDIALWSGIFRKAKKEVHGTICLVVSPEWSWEMDKDNFSRGDVLQEPVSIAYGDGTDSTRKLDDSVRMFLSMMDFDGITIIDTQGNIRAYHCFVKISMDDSSSGGSRHIALNNLKKKDSHLYKAIYFQSHEGHIEFTYLDGPNRGKSIGVFDPNVMSTDLDSQAMITFTEKARERMSLRDKRQVSHKGDILRATYQLFVAHYRIDNFYTEPEHVSTINHLLDVKENILELEKKENLAMFLIDTLIICFVGNTYGYSVEAESGIKKILKKISLATWTTFFNKENHLEEKVMEALADAATLKRWESFKDYLEKAHPELKKLESLQNIRAKDFYYMNKAFHLLKDET